MALTGHPSVYVPGGSSAALAFGHAGGVLLGVFNQSATPQTNNLVIYDCPSLAAYQANPSGPWKILTRATDLNGGQIYDVTLLNDGLKMEFGGVAVPTGVANSDGGWLVVFD